MTAPDALDTPFIVDNNPTARVTDALNNLIEVSASLDIASGYFEIGALLALDGKWQQLQRIRLLMGDEVSLQTDEVFKAALKRITDRLDQSIETEKVPNFLLRGTAAIVDAIETGKIQARIYRARKFHAKAYISHPLEDHESVAMVGSSNFTLPGLQQNVELNVLLHENVDQLQAWFDDHWAVAEDVTPDLLKVIQRHTHHFTPFEAYCRAMYCYFEGHAQSVSEWERDDSVMYRQLDQYQREGYHALMRIAARWRGALLCDGVGLGKTFIGLMVIERLLFEKRIVALIVPKAARKDVWEAKLRQYLPHVRGHHFSNLAIYNHTDLTREGDWIEQIDEIAQKVEVLIIDEAHHFRNRDSSRYRRLFGIAENKTIFLLTATPINNSLLDLKHLIELFSQRKPDHFAGAPLGIHSLDGHFRSLMNALDGNSDDTVVDPVAAEKLISTTPLTRSLVVQRSRTYVRRSLQAQDGSRDVIFPHREDPKVANYSLAKTYGPVLNAVDKAFQQDDPLLRLPMYYPIGYPVRKNAEFDPFERGRQQQIVGLIRILLLKRFESSVVAFQSSCEDILLKSLYFIESYEPDSARRLRRTHADVFQRALENARRGQDDEDDDGSGVPDTFKERITEIDSQKYNITRMVLDAVPDIDILAGFLDKLKTFDPSHDDKLQTLIRLLTTDETLSKQKVLIFTEYRDTAVYIAEQLRAAGITSLEVVHSQSRLDIGDAVRQFSPYYNGLSSAELNDPKHAEIRVLIATDILSEGLNLQDASCIINYDLHWNPVRLMQRIGRVDRRLDASVEARLVADHPHTAPLRGKVKLWNFLPPQELNQVLTLYTRVTEKTLRISKTFGIEGKKLLTPDDDFDALREFNEAYEGTTTPIEEMQLEYQQLQRDYPNEMDEAAKRPRGLLSGKAHPTAGASAMFFCYQLPAPDAATGQWTASTSFTRWYCINGADGSITENAPEMFDRIRTKPHEPRRMVFGESSLAELRHTIETHIATTYMRRVQAPAGIKPRLLTWMELN